MFFVNFSGDVLIDFHGFQINNLQLKKQGARVRLLDVGLITARRGAVIAAFAP